MKGAAPAVFSAGCVLFLAAQALATPTAQLSYARAEGAESCPDTLEVRKAISQRLGYDPVDPNSTQIMAAIVEKTPTGFRARVELIAGGGSQGLRELSSSGSCAELVSAMAAVGPTRQLVGSRRWARAADNGQSLVFDLTVNGTQLTGTVGGTMLKFDLVE